MILIASVYAKSFYGTGSHDTQHDRCDQGCDISVQDCRQCFFETDIDRTFHGFAGCDFFTDTCIDDNVCIDRHTDGPRMIPAIPGRVSVISNAFKVTSVSTVYSSSADRCNNTWQQVNNHHKDADKCQTDRSCF